MILIENLSGGHSRAIDGAVAVIVPDDMSLEKIRALLRVAREIEQKGVMK